MVRLLAHDRRRARWRELAGNEATTAVVALRELARGRADLLAEVAEILGAQRRVDE